MNTLLPKGVISELESGIIIRLHLQPRASRTEICGIHGEELKVRVTSPPVDDAANRLCIEFFAKCFSLPKSAVSIVSGHKSRHKRILLPKVNVADAVAVINSHLGQNIDKTPQ